MAETNDMALIWSNYRSGLRAFLSTKLANPSDVEDLLQDIMIKVHCNLDTLHSETTLKSWLYQIARNVIIDFYRRDKSKRPANHDDLWYDTLEEGPLPELERCLEPFINALPEAVSDLLRAIDLEGKSQKEQAAMMGISYSTLKSRVQSGRRQLRAVFEDCCEFSTDARGNIAGYALKSDCSGKC